MRTAIAIVIGAGVLALGVDSGMAAVRHHHRHAMYRSHIAPAQRAEATDLISDGNNPAKRYSTRHMPDGAIKTPTLYQAGNNPAKSYPTRHATAGASQEQTLMTNGNNPAKRATITASAH